MSAIRVAMILPGLGYVQRGAETAFIEVGRALAKYSDIEIECFGSGDSIPNGLPIHNVGCVRREKFEKWVNVPCFRNEYQYEEFTFAWNLRQKKQFRPEKFDVTISCTYPHVNWFLQKTRKNDGPLNIFVTQNGDWMCHSGSREFKYFGCDGLVTINPEYYARNKSRYQTALIPNGVDPTVFDLSSVMTKECIPEDLRLTHEGPTILMVSALIASKRVDDGIRSVAHVPGATLVVAGDGPEREKLAALATELLPGRHRFLGSVSAQKMPYIYAQADAFLHMSQIEPFGICYLEAASAGLPIVTHNGDTQRWILGSTALFNHSSDHEGIASKLRRVLEPVAGRELSEACRERVLKEWTWEVQARRYRDFIYDVMKTNGREVPWRVDVDLPEVCRTPVEVEERELTCVLGFD